MTTANAPAQLEGREIARVTLLMERPYGIFVFGSNRAGYHGGGAAKTALVQYRAAWGVGEGLSGRSYALPTKNEQIETLSLDEIAEHVRNLDACARQYRHLLFAVTRVGCGLAGYRDADVAPLCRELPRNCELPEGWR